MARRRSKIASKGGGSENILLAIAEGLAEELTADSIGRVHVDVKQVQDGYDVHVFRGSFASFSSLVSTALIRPEQVRLLLGQYATKDDDVLYTRDEVYEYEDPAWVDAALKSLIYCL